MQKKISVIIPIYNVEKYLERCLDSIVNNTYKNLEIICVNDGSSDGCQMILEKYNAIDKRFRVIAKKNGGVSSARNEGLKICTGDFVAFIDPDDWIQNNYFEVLMKYQKDGDYDIVVCDYQRSYSSDIDYVNTGGEISVKKLNRKKYMEDNRTKSYVWGNCIKRMC